MISRVRTIVGSIAAVASAAGLASALLVTSGGAASATASASQKTPVPASLQPPAGNVLAAQFTGTGVQVYQCSTAGAWVFLEPAATLTGHAKGVAGVQSAVHYKGPTWESTNDGSLVQGTSVASSPVTGSIPQLLLQAAANRGTGIFGAVTYINRLDTSGGAAPTSSCTSGQTIGVPYKAQYLFYVSSAS